MSCADVAILDPGTRAGEMATIFHDRFRTSPIVPASIVISSSAGHWPTKSVTF